MLKPTMTLLHPYQATPQHQQLGRAIAVLRGSRCLYKDSGARYSPPPVWPGADVVIGRVFVIGTTMVGCDDATDYYTTTDASS